MLNRVLSALQVLYFAGWVHRDISEGSILTYIEDGEWKAKLSDLEFSEMLGYAQSRTDPRTVSLRTYFRFRGARVLTPTQGTPYYMPHEVLNEEYLLTNHRDCIEQKSLAVRLKVPVGSPEYQRLTEINKNFCDRFKALPPIATAYIPPHGATVRYNFQRDLELIWWLVTFYITTCVDHEESQDYAQFIFQKTLTPSKERIHCFEQNFITRCGRSLHPNIRGTFNELMETLCTTMYEEYVAREAFRQLHIPESYSYIHGRFATKFRALLQHNNDGWQDLAISH